MNLFSGTPLAFRALRGRSVTLAAIFASAVLGLSFIHWLRLGLRELGLGWFGAFVASVIVVSLLARKEPEWMPDENVRRRWSYGLVLGSLFIALGVARLKHARESAETSPTNSVETGSSLVRPHHPPGK